MTEDLISFGRGSAPGLHLTRVCDEDAFLQLLDVERARAAVLHMPVLLLLVRICPVVARMFRDHGAILDLLATTVREADVIGWVRDGRLAGVVLIQGGDLPDRSVSTGIADRVSRAFEHRLSSETEARPRVRILELRPTATS